MGRKILQSSLLGALLFVAISDAFVSIPISDNNPPIALRQQLSHEKTIIKSMAIWSENPKKKSSGGLEEGMRNKLVTESIAPWRTLRLFFYGALGSGAFVGGLINLSGAVAASNTPEFNLKTEVSSVDSTRNQEN
jgi:Low psii accumulation1 / Rep27